MANGGTRTFGIRLVITGGPELDQATNQVVAANRKQAQSFQQVRTEFNRTAGEQSRFVRGLRETASQIAIVDGPLGGVASRVNALATTLTRTGLALLPVVAALSGLGVILHQGIPVIVRWEDELDRLQSTMEATGNVSGRTLEQFEAFTKEFAAGTEATITSTREALTELVGAQIVFGDTIEKTIRVGQDLTTVFGGDLVSNIKILERAFLDIDGSIEQLERRFRIQLPLSLRQSISAMQRAGDVQGGANALLNFLGGRVAGAAAFGPNIADLIELASQRWEEFLARVAGSDLILGGVTATIQGWVNLLEGLGEATFPTLEERIGRLQEDLESLRRLRDVGITGRAAEALGGTAEQGVLERLKEFFRERNQESFQSFREFAEELQGLIDGIDFTNLSEGFRGVIENIRKGLSGAISDPLQTAGIDEEIARLERELTDLENQRRSAAMARIGAERQAEEQKDAAIARQRAQIQQEEARRSAQAFQEELDRINAALGKQAPTIGERVESELKQITDRLARQKPAVFISPDQKQQLRDALTALEEIDRARAIQGVTEDIEAATAAFGPMKTQADVVAQALQEIKDKLAGLAKPVLLTPEEESTFRQQIQELKQAEQERTFERERQKIDVAIAGVRPEDLAQVERVNLQLDEITSKLAQQKEPVFLSEQQLETLRSGLTVLDQMTIVNQKLADDAALFGSTISGALTQFRDEAISTGDVLGSLAETAADTFTRIADQISEAALQFAIFQAMGGVGGPGTAGITGFGALALQGVAATAPAAAVTPAAAPLTPPPIGIAAGPAIDPAVAASMTALQTAAQTASTGVTTLGTQATSAGTTVTTAFTQVQTAAIQLAAALNQAAVAAAASGAAPPIPVPPIVPVGAPVAPAGATTPVAIGGPATRVPAAGADPNTLILGALASGGAAGTPTGATGAGGVNGLVLGALLAGAGASAGGTALAGGGAGGAAAAGVLSLISSVLPFLLLGMFGGGAGAGAGFGAGFTSPGGTFIPFLAHGGDFRAGGPIGAALSHRAIVPEQSIFLGHAQKGMDFPIPGAGATDSVGISFLATPGERIVVIPPGKPMPALDRLIGHDFKQEKQSLTEGQRLRETPLSLFPQRSPPAALAIADGSGASIQQRAVGPDSMIFLGHARAGLKAVVPGRGAADSVGVAFLATPGERVIVAPPGSPVAPPVASVASFGDRWHFMGRAQHGLTFSVPGAGGSSDTAAFSATSAGQQLAAAPSAQAPGGEMSLRTEFTFQNLEPTSAYTQALLDAAAERGANKVRDAVFRSRRDIQRFRT